MIRIDHKASFLLICAFVVGSNREEGKKNMELQVVHNQEVLGKEFKVYGTKEEPLFLAKDVAEWIEHSNVTMMLKKLTPKR